MKKQKNPTKIAIVGSRNYSNYRKIKDFIFYLKGVYSGNLIIVSGGAKDGADWFAKQAARELEIEYIEFPPYHQPWNINCQGNGIKKFLYGKDYKKQYFFIRNNQIAKFSDIMVAFKSSTSQTQGTDHAIKCMEKLGKKHMTEVD